MTALIESALAHNGVACVDKLVQLAQISGCIDVQCEFKGTWCVAQPALQHTAVLHIVVAGCGYVQLQGEKDFRYLCTGDVIFFPRAAAHRLSSSPKVQAMSPISQQQQGAMTIKRTGDSGEVLQFFCAHFRYTPQSLLFQNLPAMLKISLPSDHLSPLLKLLQNEVARPKPSSVVIDSLSMVLLIDLLRHYLNNEPQGVTHFLLGLQDARLSPVLNAILQDPSQKWTVEAMLPLAKLSRAQFMRLFKQHLNESPHAFVLRIRLAYGASLLRQTADSVLSIALQAGFRSETHFIQAFKAQYAITPSRYRHH